jgi:hypothetical protein
VNQGAMGTPPSLRALSCSRQPPDRPPERPARCGSRWTPDPDVGQSTRLAQLLDRGPRDGQASRVVKFGEEGKTSAAPNSAAVLHDGDGDRLTSHYSGRTRLVITETWTTSGFRLEYEFTSQPRPEYCRGTSRYR